MPGQSNMATVQRDRIPSLRSYRDSLSAENRVMYDEKLKSVAGIDPYAVSDNFFSQSMEEWPEVEFPDIVNYLLFSTSKFTKEQVKAYKSLQSYQYFVAGWVRAIFVGKATENTTILIGKVNHSQRLSEAPLKPWLAVKKNGCVLTGHCNCMAGLGEVCSHVGAILFAVEAGVRMLKSRTCTSVPCQWLMSSAVSNVPYAELREIDFTASSTKKRKLDERISGLTSQPSQAKPRTAYGPSTEQISKFYERLHASKTKPAILSLVSPYNKDYVPKKPATDLPNILGGLYSEQLSNLSFSDLLNKADEIFRKISCSKEQSVNVEKSTREQRNSDLWTKMRTGRITASNFHQICHTNPAKPSLSLIKQICYGSNFQSAATDWGCRQEKRALDEYRKVMERCHQNFTLKATGLWISPDHPHIGATPDAIASCDCHGTWCVEVKCLYSVRDQVLSEAVDSGHHNLCLEHSPDGGLSLKKLHPYWTQVQVQLHVTGFQFAHFVVWTEKDLHIETITRDNEFFNTHLLRANEVYKVAILPELLAKWYTQPKQSSSDAQSASKLFCYCRVKDSESLVLVCSGSSCVFKKFHLKCCGLCRRPPLNRAWFCTDCKRQNILNSTQRDVRAP